MKASPQKSTWMAWMGRRMLLSFSAALAGWAAFMIYCLIQALIRPVYGWNPWAVLIVMGMGSGVVVLTVWLIVLMPLALLIPDRSFLWKPGILTLIGVFAGPIIVGIYAIYGLASTPPPRFTSHTCTF